MFGISSINSISGFSDGILILSIFVVYISFSLLSSCPLTPISFLRRKPVTQQLTNNHRPRRLPNLAFTQLPALSSKAFMALGLNGTLPWRGGWLVDVLGRRSSGEPPFRWEGWINPKIRCFFCWKKKCVCLSRFVVSCFFFGGWMGWRGPMCVFQC